MRTTRTVSLLAAVAAALVLLTAGPASAHVTIPGTAEKGADDAIVTLSVPNEIDGASTTKVQVQMPKDVTLASVSPQAKAGWTTTTTMRHLAKPVTTDDGTFSDVVDTVTWQGGSIGPGEFDTFSLAVAPLPSDKDELSFPTIQTYSNGTVVSWIDVPPASGPEPDHPQPVLHLVDATTATTVKASSSSSSSSSDSGKGLAVGALVVAVVALGVGGTAFAGSRRRSTPTA